MSQATDALGNPIIVGCLYGYSTSNNGMFRVVIGRVVNITRREVPYGNHNIDDYSATIDIISVKSGSFLLSEDALGDYGYKKQKVSIRAHHLFPVPEEIVSRFLSLEV